MKRSNNETKKVTERTATEQSSELKNAMIKVYLSIWEKSSLLDKIAKECCGIFPANLNQEVMYRIERKIDFFRYELATSYTENKDKKKSWEILYKELCGIATMWKDAHKRGLAPLTEKAVILFIIDEIRHHLKEMKNLIHN